MIILPLTFLQIACGFLVWGRFRGCGRDDSFSQKIAEHLSIIIPARNEEGNLPKLLGSIARQSVRPSEIIVIDDGSTDLTSEVARQFGARTFPSQPLPEGWRGKTWACQQGAQFAHGKYLLFLDADTWFEQDGLARTLSEFPHGGTGALSVAPFHIVRSFHEQFSAFFNLIMLGGTGAFAYPGDFFSKPSLVGQFLLIDRVSYESVGTHEAVKSRVLENFWLAKLLHAANAPTQCRCGRDVFSFRMYPGGWREMCAGWTKGFSSGAKQTSLPILLFIVIWIGGIFFAPIGILTLNAPWLWLAIYALCVAQTFWLLRRVGSFHSLVAVFYPVFILFFFALFARSYLRSGRKVAWKGREFVAG